MTGCRACPITQQALPYQAESEAHQVWPEKPRRVHTPDTRTSGSHPVPATEVALLRQLLNHRRPGTSAASGSAATGATAAGTATPPGTRAPPTGAEPCRERARPCPAAATRPRNRTSRRCSAATDHEGAHDEPLQAEGGTVQPDKHFTPRPDGRPGRRSGRWSHGREEEKGTPTRRARSGKGHGKNSHRPHQRPIGVNSRDIYEPFARGVHQARLSLHATAGMTCLKRSPRARPTPEIGRLFDMFRREHRTRYGYPVRRHGKKFDGMLGRIARGQKNASWEL
nr:hypothetical protein ctg4_76 [Streptomyces sp.]